MQRIGYEIYEFFQVFFSIIPGTLGKLIRTAFYKSLLNRCGSGFNTGYRVRLQTPKNILVGKNVGFNDGVWIAANKKAEGKIIFGDNVLVGPYTVIHSGNHVF